MAEINPFKRRNSVAQSLLAKNKISALLVTNKTNIRYLSGFTGSAGFILLTKTKPIYSRIRDILRELHTKLQSFSNWKI